MAVEALTDVERALDRLSRLEASPFPVISVYVDARPNQNGRDAFAQTVRKELSERAKLFAEDSEERRSFDRDAERIEAFLDSDLEASANGAAIFACHGENLFETMQFEAPIEASRVYVDNQPHLFDLAWLQDRYSRFAVVVADSNRARIFVVGLGAVVDTEQVSSDKTHKPSAGGWSQARYQRHADNIHLHHAKDVVAALEQIVKEDRIERVIFAGDEVIVPKLLEQLPQALEEKVVDVLRIDIAAPEHEVVRQSLEAVRRVDEQEDEDKVRRLKDAYRAGGLATLGARRTARALALGQVDQLVLSAPIGEIEPGRIDEEMLAALGHELPETDDEQQRRQSVVDVFVTRAKSTDAAVSFIEDSELLRRYGGVGAFLRYRLEEN